MSQAIEIKKQEVTQIKEKIEKSKAVLLIDYKGLTVDQDTEMRATFRKAGLEYKVLKNTLVKRAFNELGVKDFDEALNGPTAVCFGYEDEAAACKAIFNQAKKDKKIFNIKCGQVENEFKSLEEINVLAKLPSRDELIAKFMATVNAPVQYVVYALDAIKTKL